MTEEATAPDRAEPAEPGENDGERVANPEVRTGGDDGLCFTAGFKGSFFGAGTVHAYLAADRRPPKVVAGVGMGALNAAAVQRVFRELEDAGKKFEEAIHQGAAANDGASADLGEANVRLEAKRWDWFHRYIESLTEQPFRVLRRALPQRSDFFGAFESTVDPATPDDLRDDERRAVHRRNLMRRFGQWLSRVDISLSDLSKLAKSYVRWKEGIALGRFFERLERFPSFVQKFFRVLAVLYRLLPAVEKLAYAIAAYPFKIREVRTQSGERLHPKGGRRNQAPGGKGNENDKEKQQDSAGPEDRWTVRRSLFGRQLRFFAAIFALTRFSRIVPFALIVATLLAHRTDPPDLATFRACIQLAIVCLIVPRAVGALLFIPPITRWAVRALSPPSLSALGIDRSLVDDFYFRREIADLFGRPARYGGEPGSKDAKGSTDPTIDEGPVPLVIVASALQPLVKKEPAEDGSAIFADDQLFARGKLSTVDALRAAIRAGRLFGAYEVKPKDHSRWLPEDTKSSDPEGRLDLVEATVMRRNPLPALFRFLREDHDKARDEPRPSIAQALASPVDQQVAKLFVIHEVPIEARDLKQDSETTNDEKADKAEQKTATKKDAGAKIDIVQSGQIGLRLARRRDTALEIEQTSFISRLQAALLTSAETPAANNDTLPPLYADSIAPGDDIRIANLEPTPAQALTIVADGCRRTLERLYESELAAINPNGADVDCGTLLRRVAPRRRIVAEPGLCRICRRCDGRLKQHPKPIDADVDAAMKQLALEAPSRPQELEEIDPDPSGRIVLVASGGVFRGAFHIGLAAACYAANIRPDLIVGASVGTLLGGATASLLRERKEGHRDLTSDAEIILEELVGAFVHVDKEVAITKKLRDLLTVLSVRSENVHTSPERVRHLIDAGSRNDPGFAATGAPSELIDDISTLFLTPHAATRDIAAEFVAGHTGDAMRNFWQQIRRESLRRLNIETSIIGTSLLETTARRLFNAPDDSLRQPFETEDDPNSDSTSESTKKPKIAFYATATNLKTESMTVFGGNDLYPDAPYDFVQASLASGAFPVAFTPIAERRIFPGSGDPSVFYSDGGMFDNLPFLPAIERLVTWQRQVAKLARFQATADEDPDLVEGRAAFETLKRRFCEPDLILVGALNVNPYASSSQEQRSPHPFHQTLGKTALTDSLRANGKIRSFESSSARVNDLISDLMDTQVKVNRGDADARDHWNRWLKDRRHLIAGTVNAAVLPIYPSSKKKHLNGTFAFSRSVGLKRRRVRRSIANGCFKTLATLGSPDASSKGAKLRMKAIRGFRTSGRIPTITVREAIPKDVVLKGHECPYFAKTDSKASDDARGAVQPFICPFSQLKKDKGRKVFKACIDDEVHQKAAEKLRESASSRSVPRP